MTDHKIRECAGVERCFATDPQAWNHAIARGDIGIEAHKAAIIDGAYEAAKAGTPFGEATYESVSVVNLTANSAGSKRPIAELADEGDSGEMNLRIARCTYACASAGSGRCPVLKDPK